MGIVVRLQRTLCFASLVVGLAILPTSACAADEMGLEVGPVEPIAGAICVSYRVEQPFTPRLEETLLRGMPATVTFEVGLWKRRTFWFDKLVLAIRSEHKVVYDEWAKSFRIRSGSDPPRSRTATNLDSLAATLFTARRLPITTAVALDSAATYYISVRVTLRPVAAEDLGEIESWLAGESPGANRAASGIPHYLLDLAVSLSGLGERSALATSARFVPVRLAAEPPPPG